MYPNQERSVLIGRLTTRVPAQLREHMRHLATMPEHGYRTQTQMFSALLVEFLQLKPWRTDKAWFWRPASASDVTVPLFHALLEPVRAGARDVSGAEMKRRALAAAANVRIDPGRKGVTQSNFALTFLWWIALQRLPLTDETAMRALRQVKGAVR